MPLNFLVRHSFVANQEGRMAPVNSDDETAKGSQVLVQSFQRLNHIKRLFRVCKTKYGRRAAG